MPDGPKIDAKILEEDGFGPKPFYECFVAQEPEKSALIGYVLYFYTYSTWEGRSVYMEDLYVTPSCRGRGLGTKLWQSVVKVRNSLLKIILICKPIRKKISFLGRFRPQVFKMQFLCFGLEQTLY